MRHVETWLDALAVHMGGTVAAQSGRKKAFRQYVGELATSFPSWAFYHATQPIVASKLGIGIPPLREIGIALTAAMEAVPESERSKVTLAANADAGGYAEAVAGAFAQNLAKGLDGKKLAAVTRMANLPTGALKLLCDRWPEFFTESPDLDRDWWRERCRTIRSRPHPSIRWRDAAEALAQVTQRRSPSRPWLVDYLKALMQEAEDQGADTTQNLSAPRVFPGKNWEIRLPEDDAA